MDLLYSIRPEELALLGGLLTCALVYAEWQRQLHKWKGEEPVNRFLGDQ